MKDYKELVNEELTYLRDNKISKFIYDFIIAFLESL